MREKIITVFEFHPNRAAGFRETIGTGCMVETIPLYETLQTRVPKHCDGIILSGGPMSVTEKKEGNAALFRSAETCVEDALTHNKAVLGVCLGAQFIAALFGGRIERRALVVGCETVFPIRDDGLFRGLRGPQAFLEWHKDFITKIPEELLQEATSSHGTVEAFRHRSLPLAGVQFHPEASTKDARAFFVEDAEWIQKTRPEINLRMLAREASKLTGGHRRTLFWNFLNVY